MGGWARAQVALSLSLAGADEWVGEWMTGTTFSFSDDDGNGNSRVGSDDVGNITGVTIGIAFLGTRQNSLTIFAVSEARSHENSF